MPLPRWLARSIGVALVLVVVVLVWLLAPWRRSDHGKGAGSGTPRSPVAGAAPDGSAVSPSPDPTDTAPRAATAPPAALALRFDADPRGSQRLEGSVIDEDKHTVAGVVVTISTNPQRQVTTEADGSFELTDLLPRPYTLVARAKDGTIAGPMTVRVPALEPVVMTLHARSALEVTVLAAAGRRPVAGAHVVLRGLAETSADTGAAGTATLTGVPGGMVLLEISAPGFGPEQQLATTSGVAGQTDRVTVLLSRGAPVEGRVVDSSGAAIAGARVSAEPAGALVPLGNDGRALTVDSGPDGGFRFDALPAGSFRFSAVHAPHAPGSTPAILLDGRTPTRGLELRLEAGARLAGRVVSRAGAPVPFAAVRVAPRGAGPFAGVSRQASCDDAGHFSLDGLPRRAHDVLALHDSATSARTTVDLAQKAEVLDLELVLGLDLTISGTVVSPSGAPVAGAQVTAMVELGASTDLEDLRLRGPASEVSDGAGAFTLSGLGPGSYRVRASHEAGGAGGDLWLRPGVVAAAGATGVRVTLAEDGVIKGRVVYDDGTVPELFSVAAGAFSPALPFAGGRGEFRLTGVPAGERTLVITGPRITRLLSAPITVTSGAEVDAGTITLTRGRSVRGIVTDGADRPVVGAKVMAGSVLVGDGQKLGGLPSPGLPVKTTESADDGSYEIAGLGPGALSIVADADVGRSLVLPIAAGAGDAVVALHLLPTGALEGKVSKAGAAVAGALVTAQQHKVPAGRFVVSAGSDGSFRFDRLAPGEYLVSAVELAGVGGAGMESQRVTVTAGASARADFTLEAGGVTVKLRLRRAGDAKVDSAIVVLVGGRVRARTAAELEQQVAARSGGAVYQSMLLGTGGDPVVEIAHVRPGDYSACVVLIAGSLMDPKVAEQLTRSPDTLPVTCVARPVPASPATQELELALP